MLILIDSILMNSRYWDSKDMPYWLRKFINECISTFVISCYTYCSKILKWYVWVMSAEMFETELLINTVSGESERLNFENQV